MRWLLRLVLTMGVYLGVAPVAFGESHSFVGAEKCKSCHSFEFEVWAKSPHAKAHKTLTPEQLKDAKCSNCHTLGSDLGIPDDDVRFVGVQCERCHGAGKYYQPSYVMKDKELARAVGLIDTMPAHCLQCHTEGAPSIKPFDYKTMWAKIDHSRAAREAWEKARASAPK